MNSNDNETTGCKASSGVSANVNSQYSVWKAGCSNIHFGLMSFGDLFCILFSFVSLFFHIFSPCLWKIPCCYWYLKIDSGKDTPGFCTCWLVLWIISKSISIFFSVLLFIICVAGNTPITDIMKTATFRLDLIDLYAD